MEAEKSGEIATTRITIQDPSPATSSKGKGIAGGAPVVIKASHEHAAKGGQGWRRGVAILDLVVRICAVVAALAATGIMGTTEQTLPFFTQFFQFQAQYDDLPTFVFFVIANAIVSGYLVLSVPFSIICIVRPHAAGPRLLLLIFDTAAMALTVAAASASAAIVYLAHDGNSSANWNAICQQFTNFCQQTSSAVVASFIASVFLIFLIILSGFALRKKH